MSREICRLCGHEITQAPMFRVTIEELARTPGSGPTPAFHPVHRRPPLFIHQQCAAALEERVGDLSRELQTRAAAARSNGA